MEDKILDAIELYPERNYLKHGFTACEFITTDYISQDKLIRWLSRAYIEDRTKIVFLLSEGSILILENIFPTEEIGYSNLGYTPYLADIETVLQHLSKHDKPLYTRIFDEVIYERQKE